MKWAVGDIVRLKKDVADLPKGTVGQIRQDRGTGSYPIRFVPIDYEYLIDYELEYLWIDHDEAEYAYAPTAHAYAPTDTPTVGIPHANAFDLPVLRVPVDPCRVGDCDCGIPDEGGGPWCGAAAFVTIPKEETISSDAYDPSLAEARKAMPIATGVLDYFPAALLEVAKVSKAGNDKHNPGQPLHHARGKSMNHADSLLRHLIERGGIDPETGMRHSAELAWRALALLQQELEDAGAPLARAAVLPEV